LICLPPWQPARFDMMAKHLFVRHRKLRSCTFFEDLYRAHIKTFNGGNEKTPPKHTVDDFVESFQQLIESLGLNDFNSKYAIPLNAHGQICNGSHRLAACLCLGIKPVFSLSKDLVEQHNGRYDYRFFLNRQTPFPPLQRMYADEMALEYVRCDKSHTRSMIIYPVASCTNELIRIVSKYAFVCYQKAVDLNAKGVNNLIKEAYRGEQWIGGMFPPGENRIKTQLCFKQGKPTILLVLRMHNTANTIQMKEECRNLFGLGKHSMHVTDAHVDTFRVASSILNENSVHFLNHGIGDPEAKNLLLRYFDAVPNDQRHNFCITSSMILDLYGIRRAMDVDYLHPEVLDLKKKGIEPHAGKWLTFYPHESESIIFDPRLHFFFNGFKCASLAVMVEMKKRRNLPKDNQDIKLVAKKIKQLTN